ncbi:MAG: ABC transporter ATP-binding protein [Candidatus Woesearchaeota archaeon]
MAEKNFDEKESIIKLNHVYKNYKMGEVTVKVLKDFSLDVHRGEFVVIVGPSGSGKSTLVNMIGCLDTPTEGEIFLKGKNISNLTESGLAQLRGRVIGFVFQQFNLISNLTALENVILPMIFHDIAPEIRIKKAKNILTELGLQDRLNHKPNEMSGGQQQRVAMARAISNEPEIILADEPTGNLDTKTGKNVMEQLNKLHDKGKTIILVTHDSRFIDIGTRTVRIMDGRVMEDSKND